MASKRGDTRSVEIEVLKQPKAAGGIRAKAGDTVRVHYTGTLRSNGKKFDSSRDRGTPLEFVLGKGKVIKGWDIGVEGMAIGEQRRLIIPAHLAYGQKGVGGGLIPPNADLVFEVELCGIIPC